MNIFDIVNKFLPDKDFKSFKLFGNGLINKTYLVETTDDDFFVIQKINTYVFKDVDLLMNNIHQVTKHLLFKDVESIHMLKRDDGLRYFKDEETGNCYRCYKFLTNTLTFEKVDGMKSVENSALAFGRFHNNLSDLDPNLLKETIPNFHNTPVRYQNLMEAVKNDKVGRAKSVSRELNIVDSYVYLYSLIIDGLKTGEVKMHITHNDPKINNALFDATTKSFRAIIDLDTVMPGSVLYDFGDALRSLFTGDKEDCLNYVEVVPNFDVYRHYLSAYYAETKHFLTKREIELLPYAPAILAFELGMRFLEDYLNGDLYFSTSRENHNLDRARTQLNLGESIIRNIDHFKVLTDVIVGEQK